MINQQIFNILSYLDPGTGGLFLQMLIAGVLGGLVWLKFTWKNILAKFSGNKKKRPKEQDTKDNAST